ncbi:MAG: glucose-6-phosphate isomerase [Rhodospirillales bacterium]|nr:glucose-6-phosphate isomerase [Rhodospirillales bacterium]
MASLKKSPAWKALDAHHRQTAHQHMRDLFAEDENRFERFSLRLGGLFLDYSKNRITAQTMDLLVELARARDVEGWRDRMFAGEAINTTEDRAALHVALRMPPGGEVGPIDVDGEDVLKIVRVMREKMRALSDAVRSGDWTGATGKAIETVVHIGTGGSHLGPEMVYQSQGFVRPSGPDIVFLSNVDGVQIFDALGRLSPETTLFIVASKTFTTEETITNARTARDWLVEALGLKAIHRHFIAVSGNASAVAEFGIPADNAFDLWDWVGGRYSIWSAIGLPIAIALGMDRFEDMLAGAHDMDRHFQTAPLGANLPVILGLIGLWNIDFLGAQGLAILPYDEGLRGLPNYLRQLEMESNGKALDRLGQPVEAGTATMVFGDPGTRGQHSFFQALHQGRQLIACDFIAPMESRHAIGSHHDRLLANFFAQTEALMKGREIDKSEDVMLRRDVPGAMRDLQRPHRVFEGNRPTNSILLEQVDPFTLGQLIALYEHKVFVQAVLWGINPFDQWGVEWGKELATQILHTLEDTTADFDGCSSTLGLIDRYKAHKAKKTS